MNIHAILGHALAGVGVVLADGLFQSARTPGFEGFQNFEMAFVYLRGGVEVDPVFVEQEF